MAGQTEKEERRGRWEEGMMGREGMIEILGQTVCLAGPWVAFTIKPILGGLCWLECHEEGHENVGQEFPSSDCLPKAFLRTSLSSWALLWECWSESSLPPTRTQNVQVGLGNYQQVTGHAHIVRSRKAVHYRGAPVLSHV